MKPARAAAVLTWVYAAGFGLPVSLAEGQSSEARPVVETRAPLVGA
jgi:hypothetical protein